MSVTTSSVRPGLLGGVGWRALNALQLLFTLTWTSVLICFALLLLVLCGGRRHLPLRMASRVWAPGLLGGAGARLDLEGFEAIDFSRPYIVVANHQSMIDICALFRALPMPMRFVLKQELARVPFVGAYARAMGMVFIERQSARPLRADCTMRPPSSTRGTACARFPKARAVAMGASARSRAASSNWPSRPEYRSFQLRSKAVASSFPPRVSRCDRAAFACVSARRLRPPACSRATASNWPGAVSR